MTVSFIVTSYDIAPWIETCLDSVAACARPGDRVYLVDDGSSDGTDHIIRARAARGMGDQVEVHPILLGVNTMGGVGIPANTGLAMALQAEGCETVFFVDGDDWLEVQGFTEARARFEAHRPDIQICAYSEYDEAAGISHAPADQGEWNRLASLAPGDSESARTAALRFNPVPWRKFYSADFLRRHHLRFPEGDFFFEDNPFHWEVCLRAQDIRFEQISLCQHRVNRPGQTMAATGAELQAFFDHLATIRDHVARLAPHRRAEITDWLMNNMDWHLARLSPEGYWPYATRGAEAIMALPEADWAELQTRHGQTNIGAMLRALRKGNVTGVVTAWLQAGHIRQQAQDLEALRLRVSALEDKINSLPHHSAMEEIARFKALMALPHPGHLQRSASED